MNALLSPFSISLSLSLALSLRERAREKRWQWREKKDGSQEREREKRWQSSKLQHVTHVHRIIMSHVQDVTRAWHKDVTRHHIITSYHFTHKTILFTSYSHSTSNVKHLSKKHNTSMFLEHTNAHKCIPGGLVSKVTAPLWSYHLHTHTHTHTYTRITK